MSPLNTLRQAAASLAGERRSLGPAVAWGETLFHDLPADTTAVAGGDVTELAREPALRAWLEDVTGWMTGSATLLDEAPAQRGDACIWALLSEGPPPFDPAALGGAVPRGAAWVAALRPDRFFAQAADRLEQAGHERGARWAARLRAPEGNLGVIRRNVETVALSLGPTALRLRIGFVDGTAARQGVVLLHGWRLRRAMGEGTAAEAFRTAEVVREGTRVEMRVNAPFETLLTLFSPR